MRQLLLLRSLGAASLLLIAPEAGAQEALPPIDIGAQSETASASRNARDESKQIPEGSYVAPYASTATKTDTPIMETPFDVQVVTPQQLKDRQATTVAEAIKYVGNVTFKPRGFNPNSGSGQINIRGYNIQSYLRNGFRTELSDSGSLQGLANVESVEVLKGSSAILYGLVEPGGMLNIVTKQPKEAAAYNAQQQFGSFGFYRTVVGATGPVSPDKSVLYRIDMSYENAGSFFDKVHTDNLFIAPVVRWNIGPSTQVTAELQYTKEGTPATSNLWPSYEGVPISLGRGGKNYSTGVWGNEELLVGLSWSHRFDDDWTFKHQVQYTQRDLRYPFYTNPWWVHEADGRPRVYMFADSGSVKYHQLATQAYLNGHFATGVLEHNFLLGGDLYRYEQNSGLGASVDDFGTLDPFTGSPLTPPDLETGYYNGRTSRVRYLTGVYVQDQIKLPFDIQLLGGVRYQNLRQSRKTEDTESGLYAFDAPYRAERVTPRVAGLWRPRDWLSVYANYSEGFGANEGTIYPNRAVPPTDANQWEAGVKMEFFNGKLRANFAYFDITKTNVPTEDLAHPGLGFVVVAGTMNTRGPELDLQGEILPGWNVTLSYANLDQRIVQTNDTYNGASQAGIRFGLDPRNMASMYSTYEVKDGDWKGLKFGGGVTYRDSRPMANGRTYKDPWPSLAAYATIDLMAAYAFEIAEMKWTAQLNVANLLDHHYFDNGGKLTQPGSGWSRDFLVPGEPRRLVGSISTTF